MKNKKVPKRTIILAVLLLAVLAMLMASGGPGLTLVMIGFFGFIGSLVYIVVKLFKKRFNKKYLGLPLACFIALIAGGTMLPGTSDSDQTAKNIVETGSSAIETEAETESVTEAVKILLSDFKTVDEYLAAATKGTEQGSTAMVDAIGTLARSDAETATDDQLEDAVTFITNTYPEYFDSLETMEKTMYYGYLLDYAYEDDQDPHSELGTDTYQAVKYVYRSTESIDDQSTQENLNQITKDLAALSIVTPYQESIEAEESKQESIQASKEAAAEESRQESIQASKEAAAEESRQESIQASKEAAAEKARQESIQASKKAAAEKENTEMVWISATGSKYHNKPNCGNMNPDKARQMSRSDAEDAGYDACKKCY